MQLIDGQIYRWDWLPLDGNAVQRDFSCSHTAIVHEGRLLDTFWMNFGSSFIQAGWAESRAGASIVPDDERVALTLIGYLPHLTEIRHGEERDYRPRDVVDLRHPNGSSAPVYIRRGSRKNIRVMLARINCDIEEAAGEARRMLDRVDELKKERAMLISDADEEVTDDDT